jgi:DNA-binding phage protein
MENFKTTRRQFTKLLVGGAGMKFSGLAFSAEAHSAGQRIVVPLDGEWSMEEGVGPEAIPSSFGHTVPVPGLAHSAKPSFPDVDQYQNREYILNMIRRGLYPPSEDTGVLGRTPQKRNYFWYRKSFRAPARKQVAILKIIQVDVQVIATTSRDLNVEMRSNRFRPDLWYRLNMVQIQIPPLRERREDILLLARRFLLDFASEYGKGVHKISRRAESALLGYSWPGNVRELENVIGRGCMLTRTRMLDLDDLPEEVRNQSVPAAAPATTMEEAEKQAIIHALGEARNKALVARKLGISRARLYRLMEKYGLADDPSAGERSNEAAGRS